VHPNVWVPGVVGAVKAPVPPPAGMLPVSKVWCALSAQRVCAAESLLTTVTLLPALTVIVPE
jgi:hypothetical protein